MIPDIDIYRSARVLVQRHGEDAPIHAAMRAEVVKQKAEFLNLRKTESDPSRNADKGQGDFDEDTAKKTHCRTIFGK